MSRTDSNQLGTKSGNLAIRVAQVPFIVGDLDGNVERIVGLAKGSADVDMLVTPELSICGYPPEDLMAYEEFVMACSTAASKTAEKIAALNLERLHVTIGFPKLIDGKVCNVAQVINNGNVVASHIKNHLPNYGVFDEKRYFKPGSDIGQFTLKGNKIALAICHDIWVDGFAARIRKLGVDLLVVMNASPFYLGVQAEREAATTKISSAGCDVVYVNMVGAQDEHVFDGGSHYASHGKVAQRLPFCASQAELLSGEGEVCGLPGEIEQVEMALECCVRSYVDASLANSVFVGVSGGIDSAVVLCVAAKALGADKVAAVAMPSRYSSKISSDDAKRLADNLGVTFMEIPIESALKAILESLENSLGRSLAPVAVENIQSRIRGMFLMALANDAEGLVLTTGNKSEMSTGYATLYGDMAGAFDVLKDLSKKRVYELAAHINKNGEVIPERIIKRPPTAELRENQLDSDSLPEYDRLDAILVRVVENLQSPAEVAMELGADDTLLFTKLLEKSEFKRRQAPIGPTVTKRAFGKSWRMPVCNRFSFTRYIKYGKTKAGEG